MIFLWGFGESFRETGAARNRPGHDLAENAALQHAASMMHRGVGAVSFDHGFEPPGTAAYNRVRS